MNCKHCGAELDNGEKVCRVCGYDVGRGDGTAQSGAHHSRGDSHEKYEKKDIEDNKLMAILAYLGPLVLVPVFAAPNSPYARYHANQGVILCLLELAYWLASTLIANISLQILWQIWMVFRILFAIGWLAVLALCVIGIINAVNGTKKPLPIIGTLFTIIKY